MTRGLAITFAALLGFGAPIPRGTDIPVTVDQNIPVKREKFGESFDAHVTRDVTVNGKIVIPQGAPAQVKLVESAEKSDAATLQLSKVRVNGEMRDVATENAKTDTQKSGLDTKERTAVGAAAGAVVGASLAPASSRERSWARAAVLPGACWTRTAKCTTAPHYDSRSSMS
jgi:hypothetical protein